MSCARSNNKQNSLKAVKGRPGIDVMCRSNNKTKDLVGVIGKPETEHTVVFKEQDGINRIA